MRYNSTRPSFSQPAPLATGVRAKVKWFNAEKGFGFVTPDDGLGDAFLHASAIPSLTRGEGLPEGASLVVDLVSGARGPQVSVVHDLDLSTAAPAHGGARTGGRPGRGADLGPTEEAEGTVKWFNDTKGFGFIVPDAGGKDIFVHATAVHRSGIAALAEGQRVRVQTRQGAKGPEAATVEAL